MRNKPTKSGFSRIYHAFFYSLNGLKLAYKHEAAIRQELFAGIFVVPAAFYFAESGVELSLLLGSAILVFLMELINSALEAVVDRVGVEYHPLSGQAKDIGSALVLVALILFTITWGAILFY